MKLKKFNQIGERVGFDDIDEPYPGYKDTQDEDEEDVIRSNQSEFEDEDFFYENDEEEEGEEEEDEYQGNPEIEDVGFEDVNQKDIIDNLLSTLRKMIKPSFERSYVYSDDDGSINIQFVLNKTEKISRIMKVMNLLKKLETDILIQYESEFDLWETKQGDPLITARFSYDEDVKNSKDPLPF